MLAPFRITVAVVLVAVLTVRASRAQCPQNPAGGPSLVALQAAGDGTGTDFDLGTTGGFHNIELPGLRLSVCLSGCDASTDPDCTVDSIRPDASSPGLSPPLPSNTNGVALCTALRVPSPTPAASGTANVQTGALDVQTTIQARLFLTTSNNLCPQCVSGTCQGGAESGNACQVERMVTVGPTTYALSHSCQPGGFPSGSVSIPLTLTTGTASQAACPGQSSTDSCTGPGHGACNQTSCTQGSEGITQNCCSLDTTGSCFPPAGPVSRMGQASAPTPAWGPGSAYPKTAMETAASAACAPTTGMAVLDGVIGLPGVAAAQLGATTEWLAVDPGTSTTTTQPGGTTTTLAGNCTPPDCDDDVCTTDACGGSVCTHALQPGIAGVRCVVNRMKSRPLCGTETVDPKLVAAVTKALVKADSLLAKADPAAGKKRTKFKTKAGKAIGKITKKAAKAAAKQKITDGCRTTISSEVTRILAALAAAS